MTISIQAFSELPGVRFPGAGAYAQTKRSWCIESFELDNERLRSNT